MLRSVLLLIAVMGLMKPMGMGGGSQAAKDSRGSVLLVANKGDHSLGIIDLEQGRQVATVPENDTTGHEVAASPDGQTAYVPIYGNSGVGKPGTDGRSMLVIDVTTRQTKSKLDFGHGVRPHCPIFDPVNHVLYVTTELDNSVTVIDPQTLKIVGSIPTGKPESHMLAISSDGTRGYTANVGSGTVSVLDLKARKLIQVIPVAGEVQRISISPDGASVFTSDQAKPQLAVIDTKTNQVKSWIAMPATGYGTAATPDGRWLVVALPLAKKVAIIDLRAMKVTQTVDVPASPQAVVISPDGSVAYVSCDSEHKIAVLRVGDWSVQKLMEAGSGADGLAWAARR